MTKTFPYTFDTWRRGECSEVRKLEPEDLGDYQSEYVYKFNYLRDRGWVKKMGWWMSPHEENKAYGDMRHAYSAQKYWEMIHEG